MLNPEVTEEVKQPSQQLKEMLNVTKNSNGKRIVRINFSSLSLIQECLRKAHYSLNLGLKANEESSALAFGSAIHKGLEHWYQLPTAERVLPASLQEQAECYSYGQGLEEPAQQGALEAIRQFCKARYGILSQLPEADNRSLQVGVRILNSYFKHYANDGFEVYRDSQGPVIERRFEFSMGDLKNASEPTEVIYFGTIDCVLQNKIVQIPQVTDHKTTNELGTRFFNRLKPNHQYTGYVWGAQEALGIDTNLFLVNAIQVLKRDIKFGRQPTDRNEEDFEDLRKTVLWNVKVFLDAHEASYPMTAPHPCANYSGCQYRGICELPEHMKSQVIKIKYGK